MTEGAKELRRVAAKLKGKAKELERTANLLESLERKPRVRSKRRGKKKA